jgi:hypothetical protein
VLWQDCGGNTQMNPLRHRWTYNAELDHWFDAAAKKCHFLGEDR